MKTKVIFRKFKNGDVIALFPELPAYNYYITCYEHFGQHGSADYYVVLDQTKLASPKEYQELKKELETIGYDVIVYKRYTSYMHNIAQQNM